MKKASVAEMKNNLSKYLRYVRRGGSVTIYNRDTPVAEIGPPRATARGASDDRLAASVERLAREGVARRGSGGSIEDLREPCEGPPSGVLDALLDERSSGR